MTTLIGPPCLLCFENFPTILGSTLTCLIQGEAHLLIIGYDFHPRPPLLFVLVEFSTHTLFYLINYFFQAPLFQSFETSPYISQVQVPVLTTALYYR